MPIPLRLKLESHSWRTGGACLRDICALFFARTLLLWCTSFLLRVMRCGCVISCSSAHKQASLTDMFCCKHSALIVLCVAHVSLVLERRLRAVSAGDDPKS